MSITSTALVGQGLYLTIESISYAWSASEKCKGKLYGYLLKYDFVDINYIRRQHDCDAKRGLYE